MLLTTLSNHNSFHMSASTLGYLLRAVLLYLHFLEDYAAALQQ